MEFDEICCKEGETVDDFSMHITGLANNNTVLGGMITEAKIVKKILHVAPSHWSRLPSQFRPCSI
jgi:hypothetical protein